MKYIVRDIERAVCLRFDLTPEQMRSPSRKLAVARPRQIAMFLARELTVASYPQIGRHFGGRDHTTIMHGQRNIARLLRESNEIPDHVQGVREILAHLTPYKETVGNALSGGLCNLIPPHHTKP